MAGVYGVIMAGGGGTRFWPVSRSRLPKHLLNLDGRDTMINETVKRVNKLVDDDKILIVTSKDQKDVLQQTLSEDFNRINILLEPTAKNTSACIAYAAFHLMKRFGDGVMCVFPSDHYIGDEAEFVRILNMAVDAAENSGNLVTIGIKPTFPSTGYGYIKFNQKYDDNYNTTIYSVEKFVEKPRVETAKAYVESGNYLWNSGIFVWKVSTILNNFKRFLPKMYNILEQVYSVSNVEHEYERICEVYEELESISIDYGVIERADDILVIPGDFGWNDVGTWDAIGAIYPEDINGNVVRGESVNIDSRNCIVYANNRLITTIGLEDIVVVETKDAVLVCPKDRTQDVKKIVDLLKRENKLKYL